MNSNVIEISLTNIKEVQDILTKQNLENIDLTNRINKAIEYIEQFDFDYLDATYNHSTREILEDLLDILRGKDIKETPKLIGDTPKEDKKIEKLEQKYLNANYVKLVDKINEIIDKVNKL